MRILRTDNKWRPIGFPKSLSLQEQDGQVEIKCGITGHAIKAQFRSHHTAWLYVVRPGEVPKKIGRVHSPERRDFAEALNKKIRRAFLDIEELQNSQEGRAFLAALRKAQHEGEAERQRQEAQRREAHQKKKAKKANSQAN